MSGQVISLSPTGNAVIINGADPTTLATVTGSLGTVSPITQLVIAGQTLTAGGRVTVGGDVLSLAASGTGIVVIGTVTIGGGESTATATAAGSNGKKKNAASVSYGTYVSTLGLVFMSSVVGALGLLL